MTDGKQKSKTTEMKHNPTTHSPHLRQLLQLIVNQWLTRRIGGGKFCCSPLLLLLPLLTTLGACTTDPVDPETYDTRTVTDSTNAAGSITVVVDTAWAGEIYQYYIRHHSQSCNQD